MVQGGLQLPRRPDDQFAERAAEEGGAASAERAGGVRVDDGGAQVDIDEDDTPGRVLQQRLAQAMARSRSIWACTSLNAQ